MHLGSRLRLRPDPQATTLVVVKLQAHAIVDLIILEGNVILVNGVPFLNADLVRAGTYARDKASERDSC